MKLIPTLTLSKAVGKMKTKSAEKRKGFFAMVALVLFTLNAGAQVTIPGTTLSTNASSPTPTASCVNGQYASGWNVAGKYWEWSVNASGYTSIEFSTPISSSGTGPKNGTVWYSTDNWATGTQVGSSSYTWSTSCGSIPTISLPSGANNASNLKIRLFATGATAAGGTNRVSTAAIKGTASSCTTVTAGSITVSGSTAFCEGLSTTLNLVGASSGTGITYQWQYNTGSGWVAATGVNNTTTYNVSGYAANTYDFRVVVECTSTMATANTASQTITVHANPATPVIDGSSVPSSPLIVNNWPTTTGLNLFDLNLTSGSGGSWSSNNTAFVVDDASTGVGHITSGGTGTLTYTITNFNGCTSSASATFDAVWDNTLALYAGQNGTSTGVIVGKANANSTAISATGFGTATPCGNGGLSGLTVPTNVTSWDDVDGPVYVSYKVTPASSSYAINVHQIHAKVRVSGTGPTKARIGYSLDGGSTWTVGDEVTLTSGSCGASANDWYFTFTENGITSTTNGFIAAVFPYSSASGSGTFQVNQLEVYGDVTSSTACAGTPSAGYIRTQQDTICATGDRWLELVQPGGVGITYQWQEFDGVNYVNIPGETNAFYNTGILTAPATGQYRVIVSCSGGSSANTTPISIYAVALPTATITNDVPGNSMTTGTYYDFNGNTPGAGETAEWFSNYVSTANIDVNNGDFTSVFPAKNVIVTYKISSSTGCYALDKDTFDIVPGGNVISYYLGDGGNSTSIVDVQNVTSTSLSATGFGTGTSCAKGGLSGLTNAPATLNPATRVSFTITNNEDLMAVSEIRATVRSSNSGPQNFQFAYRVNGGAWVYEGGDQAADIDDCGYSANELYWGGAGAYSLPLLSATDVLEVAIVPFNPSSSTGTFQVNSITVKGRAATACTTSTQIQDVTNTNIDGGSLCLGTNALHLQTPATETYWMNVAPNDPSIAYFDYTTPGSLEVVSTYTDAIIFAVAYRGSCLELNSAIVDYVACSPKTSGINAVNASEKVAFYPNPATNVVNVKSEEAVNVTINSIDGKTVVQQKDATRINIGNLANGVYFIHAYDSKNMLIKTEKLVKQ